MRRFLAAWGPPMFGGAVTSGSVTAATWAGLGGHFLYMPAALLVAIVSAIACLVDILDNDGPEHRGDKVTRTIKCAACAAIDLKLAAVTRDRDELRQALVVLDVYRPAAALKPPGET